MSTSTQTAPAVGARIQGMHSLGGVLTLDHRGKVSDHTRNDAGEVRGIVVAFPAGDMPYGLATRGEYWRVLPEQGEPEAWR